MYDFDEIQKDEVLCVSTGKRFKPTQTSKLDIEIKANWSRAHKQYGKTATDVTVHTASHPKINVSTSSVSCLFEQIWKCRYSFISHYIW